MHIYIAYIFRNIKYYCYIFCILHTLNILEIIYTLYILTLMEFL